MNPNENDNNYWNNLDARHYHQRGGMLGDAFSNTAGRIANFGLGFLGGMHNRQQDYNDYANNEQDIANKFNPYVNAGTHGLNQFSHYSDQGLSNPGGLEDQLAGGFRNSTYQNQMNTNLRHQMNMNNAQTGQLMSTSGNAALENALAGQENQFMNQYINRGTNQYNQALQNQSLLARFGLQGLGGYGYYQDAADMGRFAGSNQSKGGFLSGLEGGIGALL